MIVTFELRSCEGHARRITTRRRDDWLPPDLYREHINATEGLIAWRDYKLDRRASADRGVAVYRQIYPRNPEAAA